jgi:hypothetical protein
MIKYDVTATFVDYKDGERAEFSTTFYDVDCSDMVDIMDTLSRGSRYCKFTVDVKRESKDV